MPDDVVEMSVTMFFELVVDEFEWNGSNELFLAKMEKIGGYRLSELFHGDVTPILTRQILH